ncbi:oxidoreductase [Sphaerisporangium siamense]|uniref:Putative PhzF superfamily epimerase YddE/YHI9 n=1 Tax=Sphaerisporangium siamense TaxID=795645 RepID=A0A7W7D6S3_9ACTN|nr:PhzF family phenazine biosynthesis protein [Sphaerisporangium siamense]MBB4700415.1 putative PhzF superfamily epimerase YddE/YHI9 [Sphaerisporangium siamense]GII88423.1 oxidoreductase [Sphaerisporangium siamense]
MRIFTVDSFTDRPFKGNPAAVCLLESPRSDEWMQALASEMRHSETAFLLSQGEGRPWSLRWFTPTVEVALCGHATLASAHVLYSTGAASGSIEFSTKSGILTTRQLDHGRISMDFPASPPAEISAPEVLVKALRASPAWVGMGRFDLLAVLDSEEAVRTLDPDLDALATLPARAVCVTARAATHPNTTLLPSDATPEPASATPNLSPSLGPDYRPSNGPDLSPSLGPDYRPSNGPNLSPSLGSSFSPSHGPDDTSSHGADYVSRFFAPAAGIPEDPVTGSAHCMLAPYWTEKLGSASLTGVQLSARGGTVHTTVDGDRVHLAGQALTIWSGHLHI